MPEPVLLLGKLLGAAPGTEDHADLALLVEGHGGIVEAGVLKSFGGGRDGERDDTRHVLAFARIDPGQFVELGNLACNMHGQAGGIEAGDALDPGFTSQHGMGEGIVADAIRADHAHPGDDDARKHAGANQMEPGADCLQGRRAGMMEVG